MYRDTFVSAIPTIKDIQRYSNKNLRRQIQTTNNNASFTTKNTFIRISDRAYRNAKLRVKHANRMMHRLLYELYNTAI